MSSRKVNFIKLLLNNSPMTQHQNFMKLITVPQSHNNITPPLISDQDYLSNYLRSLQSTPTINHQSHFELQNLKKITGNAKIFRSNSSQPEKETQQLAQNIRNFGKFYTGSLIAYQQLQQRITIAQPETLNQVRSRLTYLFKILLNKRNKLIPASLQMEANFQLSSTIIKAFSRAAQYPESKQEWKKLEAMEKLLQARQYKKKGLYEIAIASFQQIFKDEAAEERTRMEALRVLCSESQEHKDTSILQPLISVSQQKGEKEFQQCIMQSIKKIKEDANSK